MKASLILIATFMVSAAQAGEYQNWIGASAQIDCKTIFEKQERAIVKTIKANIVQDDIDERIESVEIYSQVQFGKSEAKRKYVVKSVKVDAITDAEVDSNYSPKPTLVEGKHLKTGEKIKIKIFQDEESDVDGYQKADLSIGGKTQNYLKLLCRVIFAG